MLFLSIIWAIFSGAALAVGVESRATWKSVWNLGSAVDSVRRLLLIGGLLVGAGTIVWTFYYNVLSNAVIVLAAWLATFLIGRLFVEIMKRKNVYGEGPVARPLSSAYGEKLETAANAAAAPDEKNLPDIGEVEEIEANFQMQASKDPAEIKTEDVAAAEDAPDMEFITASEVTAPTPGPVQPPITEPPMESDDPRSAEYNEIFRRLNEK